MTDERRVEVAYLALAMADGEGEGQFASSRRASAARAVVAALDAHDGDLRERLAGAVEALREPFRTINGYSGARNGAFTEAARLIRERP